MKHSVELFLKLLKETVLDGYDEQPSVDFVKGVDETINYAATWFESNGINEFDINPNE